MRPSIRLRLTLLYAGVLFVGALLLLSVSYMLVRNNLTAEPLTVGPYDPAAEELRRLIQREVAADALDRLRAQYAVALAALTGLSVLLGWAVAGHVLRPLQRITATAKRVSQDNLDERIAMEGPRDELKELADTVDGMLERLAEAFAAQRRFVANASHELRTPLSVIRTELEVTLADPDASADDLRAMARRVRDATEGTERLIRALLVLARSHAGVTRRDDADLAEAARTALAQVAGEAAAGGLEIRSTLDPAPVCGDRGLLDRLVANLVENAVRHNRPDGRVEVTTGQRGRSSLVEVANDGPAVPPDAVDRLLEPFQRLDRGARGDGAGLGLSIVRSVAEAHGGRVTLAAREEGGLTVAVVLPAASARPKIADPPGQTRYPDDRARAHA